MISRFAWCLVVACSVGQAACPGQQPGKKPPGQQSSTQVWDAAAFVDPDAADCGLQRAIDHVAASGGGEVAIPAGQYSLRRGLILRDGVRLAGAGIDKTLLRPARRVQRLDVAEDGPRENRIVLQQLPDDLQVGSAVVSCRSFPPAWYGSPRPAAVTAIDRLAKAITIEAPYGLNAMRAGEGYVTFGDTMVLARSVRKGDAEIELRDASLIRPGDELALGEPPNESLLAHVFVREVRGSTLILEQPAQIDFEAWPPTERIGNKKVNALVWALFPLIHAANVRDCGIRDLTVQGHGMATIRPMQTRYTLAGIHLYNGQQVEIHRVAVRDWPSDGISLQAGTECRVVDCQVTGCLGNGLHPGTGLTDSTFERNISAKNATGLYFCWHNCRHQLMGNRFESNREGGITGLGNPGDRENVIEDNIICGNGGPGIAINGGQQSGNIIRRNTIQDNSQDEPGKHPGIALYASTEDARGYVIVGNTIGDTQATPTQHVGIEERHGRYRDRPTAADENRICENRFGGHLTADIILAGEKTLCENNGNASVVLRRSDADSQGK